jgi:hypothetical protein
MRRPGGREQRGVSRRAQIPRGPASARVRRSLHSKSSSATKVPLRRQAVVRPTPELQVVHRRRPPQRKRPPVMHLQPAPLRAAVAAVVHERAARAIAVPDLAANRDGNVAPAGRRCGASCGGGWGAMRLRVPLRRGSRRVASWRVTARRVAPRRPGSRRVASRDVTARRVPPLRRGSRRVARCRVAARRLPPRRRGAPPRPALAQPLHELAQGAELHLGKPRRPVGLAEEIQGLFQPRRGKSRAVGMWLRLCATKAVKGNRRGAS